MRLMRLARNLNAKFRIICEYSNIALLFWDREEEHQKDVRKHEQQQAWFVCMYVF